MQTGRWRHIVWAAAGAACFLLFVISSVQAYTSPGQPTGYVNDYTNTLSAAMEAALEDSLQAYTASTTNEIAVVIIPSLQEDTIENVANQLFQEWGIGQRERDNGILLLIAMAEREVRIEVGYGLEGAVTDLEAKDIIDTIITPRFRDGEYDLGTDEAVTALEMAIGGEYVPLQRPSESANDWMDFVWGGLVIVLQIFFAYLARSRSWWAGGIVGAVVAIVLGWFAGLTIGAVALAVLVPIGLGLDYIISRGYHDRKEGRTSWYTHFGGGSSGGGGFGGFGGGSSGGGGASGRW